MNKKLLATLIAATFAAPVAVYAEEDDGPTLYGRLHLGIEHSDTDADGSKLDVRSNSSRFGIKGDTDLGNGLNVFYQYEFGVDADTANIINNNRVARVGFGGSFGKIALGQQWSAMFNHVGTFMDISQALGTSGTTYRVGNDLQYSVSAGPVNIQADLILDGANGASDGLDRFQIAASGNFGAFSIGLGYQQTAEAIEGIEGSAAVAAVEATAGHVALVDASNIEALRNMAEMYEMTADTDEMAADTAEMTAAATPSDASLQTAAMTARDAADASRVDANMRTQAVRDLQAGLDTLPGAAQPAVDAVVAVPAYDSSQIGIGAGVTFGNFFIKGGYVNTETDGDTKDNSTAVLNIGGSSDNGLSGFVSFGEQESTYENDFIIGQIRKDIGGGTQVYVEARSDDNLDNKGDRTQVLLAMRKDF